MSRRILWYAVCIGLVGVFALVLLIPEHMINPGTLLRDHQSLGKDCFSCHTPFFGSRADNCVECHRIDRIGLFTTEGQPILKSKTVASFHQKLIEQNCTACHGEHQGVDAADIIRFSHQLLQPDMRTQCASCHARPKDSLHDLVTDGCQQCHGQSSWRPATFDHEKYFVLDDDHNVKCSTCHTSNTFSRYTCYGCHEHTPDNIREEHVEEGIRNFENCVECHRGPWEPEENGEGRGEGDN